MEIRTHQAMPGQREHTEPSSALPEDRFRALVHALTASQIVWTTTAEGQLVEDIPSWRAYTGQTIDEMRGRGWLDAVDSADRQRIAELWEHSVRERSMYKADCRLRRFDGVYRHCLVHVAPVLHADGSVREWVGASIDIEDRLQLLARERIAREEAEAARQRVEALQAITDTALAHLKLEKLATSLLARVRDALDVDNVAILLPVPEGNELAIFSVYGPEEEVAEHVRVPIGEGVAGTIMATGKPLVVDDLATSNVVNPFLRHNLHSLLGVPLIFEDRTIGVLHVSTVQPRQFTGTDRSLLERAADRIALAIEHAHLYENERQARARADRQAREIQQLAETLESRVAERTRQLQDANSELEAFAYSVSHDLRAPLRAMEGFAQALQEDYAGALDAMAQTYIERIAAAARRMDVLIQDLLAYSRLSRTEVQPERIRLEVVVATAQEALDAEIQARGAQITVDALPYVVRGNRSVLQQVVFNLLANAIKFVAPLVRPCVHVRAEPRDDGGVPWVRLWVEDAGIGISPEYHERIFRTFERLHGEDEYPGTGIGLAIVRKGVERMGGHAGVESIRGQGSRFWIELPRATSAET